MKVGARTTKLQAFDIEFEIKSQASFESLWTEKKVAVVKLKNLKPW